MNDRLLDVLAAVEAGKVIPPPHVPTVELLADRRMTLGDAPRVQELQQYVFEELEIQLAVVGGGVGCTRIVVTAECQDVSEARRLLNELFSSEAFSKAAVKAGFNDLLRYQPYAHKTLASGRLLGQLPEDGLPVFISYAHEDDGHRVELEKHISALVQQKLLKAWHDRRISGGKEWATEIERALESARIILLLVSSDFIASEYCTNIEVPYALRRHQEGNVRSIPVIVRPADWEETPLAVLQALPTDAKPITLWANQDQAWTDVAKHLRRIVRELRQA